MNVHAPLDAGTDTATAPIREALAAFAAQTDHAGIPAEVRTRAMHHMLDAAGIALASTRYDFALRTLTALRGLGGEGPVPVIGMPAHLPPRDAAMVNGLLCHGLDFDDTHIAGVVHPTASVFSAVLSAAHHAGASGRDMVTAYVIGVEAAARIGMVARGGFHQVGFHPTGMVGVFGCALAAGRIFGLTEKQLAHAQGIALSLASGSLEFLEDGAWNKRFHPGWAANAGITAAALAREEFFGITRPYDGRFGLYNAYLGELSKACDLSLATAGLGEEWELMNTAIKPYPACHFTHGCIDAALALAQQGIGADRIASIVALVPAEVVKTVCEPEANKKRPANSYDAQFSIPYLVATPFVRGRFTLAELEDEALTDPAILALADRVSYRADPDSPFPRAYSGEVIVTLKDGTEHRHREHVNRGAADRPLTNAEIVEKYEGNAAMTLARGEAERFRAALLGLDTDAPAAGLLATLGRPSA
ncbi:MAG: MmgE/PrpD family protein [Alphaproteobacteria bacterium]|nr:MmgE/PrpD family protein [Alphaproteobacteria bacterium]MDX5369755.1 MmgE/PrpD family protein [Alphaproteobacteria bacterium]MDX5464379.1 MmgE/PrpD family protein [Alphaproteobacteria bacterium]